CLGTVPRSRLGTRADRNARSEPDRPAPVSRLRLCRSRATNPFRQATIMGILMSETQRHRGRPHTEPNGWRRTAETSEENPGSPRRAGILAVLTHATADRPGQTD